MPEVRNEYPFQADWHEEPYGALVHIRAESLEELRERVVLLHEAWQSIFSEPVTIEAGDSAPANQQPAPPPPTPVPQGPTCGYEGCGKTMEWRTGSKDGVPWKGWFCPTRNRAHKAIWV